MEECSIADAVYATCTIVGDAWNVQYTLIGRWGERCIGVAVLQVKPIHHIMNRNVHALLQYS